MLKTRKLKGFTLIEILVVVALIAILTAITFIAINPAKNFADTRNAQRSSDVTQILNAVTQYTSEQGHALGDFGTIPLCTVTTACVGTSTAAPACVDLGTPLVDTYIVGIPKDPLVEAGVKGTDAVTGYTICRTASGRVTIAVPLANQENGKVISVSR
jgi:prepilin-type N-terminal cleavage/methylation domain-containing protein